MPPKAKVCKEDILTAAVQLVRREGAQALNARALAARLGCSTQPVFSNYAGMEQLKADVMDRAGKCYGEFVRKELESGKYPAYKASGMAYIRFAKEEPELFKLLFMRGRTPEEARAGDGDIEPIVRVIQENTGLPRKLALLFHLEIWGYVHGIASMLVTGYLDWDWELISESLTDVYQGLRARFGEKECL